MNKRTMTLQLEEYNKSLELVTKRLDGLEAAQKKASSSTMDMSTNMLAMSNAMKNLGGAVPAVTSAFQVYKTTQEQVNVACKAFAANPVGATIQIIAAALGLINTIIDKFMERINASAELTDKWNEATAALEPIMKGFNAVLDVVVETFIKVIEWGVKGVEIFGKIGDKISQFFGGTGNAYKKASEEAKYFAKQQAQLDQEENKRLKERAESEARQGKLREQIANAEGEAKKKLLENLKEEIKAQTSAEIAINKKRIALMKYQQSLGPTSKAEQQALAELEAQTNRLIGEQGKQLAKIDKQINSTSASIASSTKKNASSTVDKILDEIKRYVKERDALLNNTNKTYSDDRKIIKAVRDRQDAELALTVQTEEEKTAIKKQRLQEDIKDENAHYNRQVKLLEDSIAQLEGMEAKTAEQKAKIAEELAKYKEQLFDLETEHEVKGYEFQTEQYKIQKEEQLRINKEHSAKLKEIQDKQNAEEDEYRKEVAKREKEEQEKRQEAISQLLDTADYIADNFDKLSGPQQLLMDSIQGTTAALYNEIKAFKDLGEANETASERTKLGMKVVGMAMQQASAIINSYINAKQNQIKADLEAGKITEEEAKKQFEKTKKTQIATTLMSMFGGIAEAVASAMELGPILGPIIGGINSAAVAASGAMQIANIKKTTLEGGGSGTDNASSSSIGSTFSTGLSVNPLLNEDYDLASITQSTSTIGNSTLQDQRVYIVEDDIQESNRRVEIRENNTTF